MKFSALYKWSYAKNRLRTGCYVLSQKTSESLKIRNIFLNKLRHLAEMCRLQGPHHGR